MKYINIKDTKDQFPTMSPLPTAETHQIIRAVYTEFQYFIVPKDWEVDELYVHDGNLYRMGVATHIASRHDTYSMVNHAPEYMEVASSEDYLEFFDCISHQELIERNIR